MNVAIALSNSLGRNLMQLHCSKSYVHITQADIFDQVMSTMKGINGEFEFRVGDKLQH